jgi:hypothetical protein
MPETMAQGPILKALDVALSDATKRQRIYEALKAAPTISLASIAAEFGIADKEQEQHLRDDWFGVKWWSEIDAGKRESVVRACLIRAIELVNEKTSRVVDSYWVCHPGHEEPGAEDAHHDGDAAPGEHHNGHGSAGKKHFEACVCYSDEQVTIFLHTPDPPATPPGWGDPIFLVKIDGAGQIKERDLMTGKILDVLENGTKRREAPASGGLEPSVSPT